MRPRRSLLLRTCALLWACLLVRPVRLAIARSLLRPCLRSGMRRLWPMMSLPTSGGPLRPRIAWPFWTDCRSLGTTRAWSLEDGRHRAARADPRLVAQDVRCWAARADPRLVARGAPCRAVLDDPDLVARDVRHWAVQGDLLQGGLHPVALVASLAGRGDCRQGDLGARHQAAERRGEVVDANSAEAGARRVD